MFPSEIFAAEIGGVGKEVRWYFPQALNIETYFKFSQKNNFLSSFHFHQNVALGKSGGIKVAG
jgi:hypothetical protein